MAKREIKTKYGKQQARKRSTETTMAAFNAVAGVTGIVGGVIAAVTGLGAPVALASASAGYLSLDAAAGNMAAAKLAAAKSFAAEHFARRARPSLSFGPGSGGVPGAPGAPGGPLFNEVNSRAANPADKGVQLWDRVTNAMEMGKMHPKAEDFYSPFQSTMASVLQKRGEIRQGRAYLNDAAARKAQAPTTAPVQSRGQRAAAASQPSSNGMVKEYTRSDGTRVQGYRRSN